MDDLATRKLAGLERAKAAVKGNTALAKALPGNITPQAISQWRQVPAERALEVEAATGVPRHELRPDIYPPPFNITESSITAPSQPEEAA